MPLFETKNVKNYQWEKCYIHHKQVKSKYKCQTYTMLNLAPTYMHAALVFLFSEKIFFYTLN